MFKAEIVNENNKQRFIDVLRSDVVGHVFAYYDVQFEPEHTTVYAAFEDESLRGYILIYTALEFPSVVLEGESSVAERLIGYAPEGRFIMHAPRDLLPIVKGRFSDAKHYAESWMIVRRGDASFFRSELVRRLCSEVDTLDLFGLLSSREDRRAGSVEKYVELIGRQPIFGVFVDGELVSYAGSFIQLPQVWMIGGVYTRPDLRGRGYGTLATSAVTEEALRNSEVAALFVRSDNYSAVKVYEKIGYKKIGEKLWIDMGTGMKP